MSSNELHNKIWERFLELSAKDADIPEIKNFLGSVGKYKTLYLKAVAEIENEQQTEK